MNMRKYQVNLHKTVSVSISVGVTDAELAEIAKQLGVQVDDLTDDDVRDRAVEKAHEHELQELGICCSGYGEAWSRQEDDTLELDEGKYAVTRLDDDADTVNDYDYDEE